MIHWGSYYELTSVPTWVHTYTLTCTGCNVHWTWQSVLEMSNIYYNHFFYSRVVHDFKFHILSMSHIIIKHRCLLQTSSAKNLKIDLDGMLYILLKRMKLMNVSLHRLYISLELFLHIKLFARQLFI